MHLISISMNPAEPGSNGGPTPEPERGVPAVPGILRITLRRPTQDIHDGSSAEPTTLEEISIPWLPECGTSPVTDDIERVESQMPESHHQAQGLHCEPFALAQDQELEDDGQGPVFSSSPTSVKGSVLDVSEVTDPSSPVDLEGDCKEHNHETQPPESHHEHSPPLSEGWGAAGSRAYETHTADEAPQDETSGTTMVVGYGGPSAGVEAFISRLVRSGFTVHSIHTTLNSGRHINPLFGGEIVSGSTVTGSSSLDLLGTFES